MSQKPTLGRIVLVTTPLPLGGQRESVGIVTRVVDDAQVDLMLLPAGGGASPVSSVYPAGHPFAGAHSWRWPDRAGPPVWA